jgi:hypothetical protein
MTQDIELATIDLRYESYRLRNPPPRQNSVGFAYAVAE